MRTTWSRKSSHALLTEQWHTGRTGRSTVLAMCGALTITLAAHAQDPPADDVAALLESAAAALLEHRPHDALPPLNRVEAIEPDNPWLWQLRGSAHRAIGNPYEALACYDTATEKLAASGSGDDALASRIRRDRAAARRDVFGVSLRLGAAYDSNVTFLGDVGSTLDVISGREDGRVSLGFSVDFAPIADETHTLAFGVRTEQSWHFLVDTFDFQDYGGYLRYARRLAPRWQAELRYDYDFTLLGRGEFLSNHALTPSLTYDWPASVAPLRLTDTRAYFRASWQDFRIDTDRASDRDGTTRALGIEQRLSIGPFRDSTWSAQWRIGYFFETTHTAGTQFDRRTHALYAGVSAPLRNPRSPNKYLIFPDKELRLALDVAWQRDDYRGRSLVDRNGSRRRDIGLSGGATLSQLLMSDPDGGEVVVHLFVHFFDVNSNVATREGATPFSYEKVVAGLQIQWSW